MKNLDIYVPISAGDSIQHCKQEQKSIWWNHSLNCYNLEQSCNLLKSAANNAMQIGNIDPLSYSWVRKVRLCQPADYYQNTFPPVSDDISRILALLNVCVDCPIYVHHRELTDLVYRNLFLVIQGCVRCLLSNLNLLSDSVQDAVLAWLSKSLADPTNSEVSLWLFQGFGIHVPDEQYHNGTFHTRIALAERLFQGLGEQLALAQGRCTECENRLDSLMSKLRGCIFMAENNKLQSQDLDKLITDFTSMRNDPNMAPGLTSRQCKDIDYFIEAVKNGAGASKISDLAKKLLISFASAVL
ncbi:MAG: hypothetical protein LBR91_02885 [Puniceicoccales bacterium]|nr:hypothetical protein [Puniceicoccales bacterium]